MSRLEWATAGLRVVNRVLAWVCAALAVVVGFVVLLDWLVPR